VNKKNVDTKISDKKKITDPIFIPKSSIVRSGGRNKTKRKKGIRLAKNK